MAAQAKGQSSHLIFTPGQPGLGTASDPGQLCSMKTREVNEISVPAAQQQSQGDVSTPQCSALLLWLLPSWDFFPLQDVTLALGVIY